MLSVSIIFLKFIMNYILYLSVRKVNFFVFSKNMIVKESVIHFILFIFSDFIKIMLQLGFLYDLLIFLVQIIEIINDT